MRRGGPLRRKTPLRRGGPIPRRTPLRGRPRPVADRVSGTAAEEVFARDRICIGARLAAEGKIPAHACRDVFETPHAPDDRRYLTLDHVWRISGGVKGDRAPSDVWHMTPACGALNDHGMTHAVRQGQRDYLDRVAPLPPGVER